MNNTKFKKGISGSQKATKGFSKSMANLGGTIAAAFSVRAITNFTKASFQALDTQLKAERSLLVALNGRVLAQQMLIKQAKQLQGVTLYGDEETIRAAALIGTMVKEEETIKRLIPLVQDFATAKQMQLTAAADLVAKSIGSSTNALSRYGITITGAVGSSERLQTAVDALTKAFGGQAEAAAEADRMLTQVKNSWGDFQEAFAGWLSSGGGGFIRRGVVAGIDDLTKLFTPKTTAAMVEFGQFMETLKDKKPAEQASILSSRLEEQRAAFMKLVEQRKAQQKIIDDPDSRRVAIRFAKTEVDKINEKQDALLEIISLYKKQLDVIKDVGEGQNVEVKTQQEIFEAWKKENDAIRTRIELQENLTDAINETKLAHLDALREIVNKPASKKPTTPPGVSGYLYDNNEEWMGGREPWEDIADKMERSKAAMKEFGRLLSQTLVSQVDTLGESLAKFASGAEDSFKGLGDAIMQNLGNILIMMGAQSGNLPIVLAGAAIQLGGGFLRGLGKDAPKMAGNTYAGGGNVNFRISGKDLVGVIDKQNYSNNMNT
jgi:hypothetical protein